MELRSGRRLRSLPMPGPRRSQRPPDFPDGDGSDWISDRPDEMLLQILVRLRCARAAAHTSSLSRRWRGLWRHLPELSFRDISADALNAALDQVACPALSFLEVDILQKHRVMDPVRVSALLHAAARLAPADLVFRLWGHCKDGNIPIEIPCFERATSVKLLMVGLYLIPPAGGVEFPLLERLSVTGCRFDTEELVHRCPRLRVFEVSQWFYGTTVVKVHSSTIEELVVEGNPSNIDIMAPVLKRFSLWVSTAEDFTLSFSAPMVENISWYCSPMVENSGFGEIWRLGDLKLEMKENVGVLRMRITISVGFPGEETCSPNCPCDRPRNWRNKIISLTALEEVEVTGFGETDHEVDFLKLLFRSATLMKSMTVVLAPGLPTDEDCEEIYCTFEANPHVKCSVYRSTCKD
ncbi:hypothetical protein ACQ4PT_002657 [Festuca glaucescens]